MTRRYLVFTDLDGTLLEERTYAPDAAAEALARLKHEGHPLVFCTSKTFAECQALQGRMGITGPVIVENGGGIYVPRHLLSPPDHEDIEGWKRISLGVPYAELRRHLAEVRQGTGIDMIGLGDAGISLLTDYCGLSMGEAGLAMQREYDEPFLLPGEDSDVLERVSLAFQERWLNVSRGGRFFHLSGNTDKGLAVRILTHLFQEGGHLFETVGLGDSPNDIPMLSSVEHRFLVMRPGGFHHPEVLAQGLSGLQAVKAEGPVGWNLAVLDLLDHGPHGR